VGGFNGGVHGEDIGLRGDVGDGLVGVLQHFGLLLHTFYLFHQIVQLGLSLAGRTAYHGGGFSRVMRNLADGFDVGDHLFN